MWTPINKESVINSGLVIDCKWQELLHVPLFLYVTSDLFVPISSRKKELTTRNNKQFFGGILGAYRAHELRRNRRFSVLL
jgi:hypothetical protein